MGGMAGVGVAPPPNHPPTSLAGGSTRARHPGPSSERARGVAANAILGAFRCRSPPSHPTCTPDNPLQTAPFLIARYDDARAKPTHARALRRRRRSLARSIARARCGGGGGGGGRLRRPSRALRAPRVTRVYAYVITAHRARHRRFPSPPRTTGTRALLRRRRSLARSRARRRRRWGWGWRSVTPRVTRFMRVMRVRVRHQRASRASLPPPFPDVTHARARQRWRRCLVCSLPRARGGGGGRSFARRACLKRHARARACHPRHGTY